MHSSVLSNWHAFSAPKEGRVYSMYVDVFNYVTTGVGNLIEDRNEVLSLAWKRSDGSFATPDEVMAEWRFLKDHPGLIRKGKTVPLRTLGYPQYQHLLKLRLNDGDIDALVLRRLKGNEALVKRKYFPMWDEFPADGQMAIMSMAWAVGAGFPAKFTNFTRCVLSGNWGTYDPTGKRPPTGAVACAKIRDGLDTPAKDDDNPGVVPRNLDNFQLLHNAGVVVAKKLDPSQLIWPNRPPGLSPEVKVNLTAASDRTKEAARVLKEIADEAVDRVHRERNEQLKER